MESPLDEDDIAPTVLTELRTDHPPEYEDLLRRFRGRIVVEDIDRRTMTVKNLRMVEHVDLLGSRVKVRTLRS